MNEENTYKALTSAVTYSTSNVKSVDSVLIVNKDAREENLKRNKDIYKEIGDIEGYRYPSNGVAIGKLGIVDGRNGTDEGDVKISTANDGYGDLLQYTSFSDFISDPQYRLTHFGDDAAKSLNKLYLTSIWAFNSEGTYNNLLNHSVYRDYEQYMEEVYDLSDYVFTVNQMLSPDTFYKYLSESNMKALFMNTGKNDVGVFRDVKIYETFPKIAELWRTTINPNSTYSDSILGRLSNMLNAYTLNNSVRYNNKRSTQYITPQLKKYYGVNSDSIGDNGLALARRWAVEMRNEKTGEIKDTLTFLLGDDTVAGMTMSYKDAEEEAKKGEDSTYDITNLNRNLTASNFNYLTKTNRYSPKDDNTYIVYLSPSASTYTLSNGISWKATTTGKIGESRLDGLDQNTFEKIYVERDSLNDDTAPTVPGETFNYTPIGESNNGNDILTKTKGLFDRHIINTLVSRFHNKTNNLLREDDIDSTNDSIYGNSHGRNLISAKPNIKTNGYSNPYCRTWTWHHSYGKLKSLIRNGNFDTYEKLLAPYRRKDGFDMLKNRSVLTKAGFVRIAPDGSNEAHETKLYNEVTRCMFSLENLAWKSDKRSRGRIMWFPPYNINFNESVNVEWNSNTFIGRGEDVFTYTDTNRTATLSFDILADYPMAAEAADWGMDDEPILNFFAGSEKDRVKAKQIYFSKNEKMDNVIENNEYMFFKEIAEDPDFNPVKQKIMEKFRYFTPVFHSVSPEGFNARLTFLQQCTRQGATNIGAGTDKQGNKYVKPATNLSFGRSPICILRIGDFIKTRVVVNSLGIEYNNGENITWDLNPEGVGVQPMFARITLTLTILGGQSLAGPISRLQNAVTFDYYANTGVYEKRADLHPEGDFWTPQYAKKS